MSNFKSRLNYFWNTISLELQIFWVVFFGYILFGVRIPQLIQEQITSYNCIMTVLDVLCFAYCLYRYWCVRTHPSR